MQIPDDSKLHEDIQLIESPHYLVRYHACNRILKFFGLKTNISDLKRVFSLICDKRHPDKESERQDFEEARIRLFDFIDQETSQPDFSSFSFEELNEQLMQALYTQEPNTDRAEKLLTAEADPLWENEKGESAFLVAASKGHQSWIQRFLEMGGDINQKIPGRNESVFLANVDRADLSWLKEMASYRANLQDVNGNGENAVFLCRSGSSLMAKVQWLHEKGVDLDMPNFNGETAFYNMMMKNDLEMLKFLGEHGANPNPIRKNTGETALLRAIKYENYELIRLLLDLGADPEIRGADGQNAFELAMARGSRESVIILRGEVGAALLEQSDEQRKVAQLKLEILAALKQGKSWNSSHKEGSTRFWFDGKAYQHSYQEHQSDFVETNSIPDDASALQWLYDQNKYGFGSETMLKIYQGILERL